MKNSRVLITGGAGFIGSHVVDEYASRGSDISILDNLSSGRLENVEKWLGSPSLIFARRDLLKAKSVVKMTRGCEAVFHLAANPEVRLATTNPTIHFEQNILATFNLLEAVRNVKETKAIVFTSSSTVYGEPSKIPTPEDYGPLKPISVYGSSKLSCEALIAGYAYTYGFKAVICRLANVIGPRSTHGVVYDLVQKLGRNPRELEVLGDGSQTKSYLFIDDCISAMRVCFDKAENQVEIFNIGSEDQTDVKTIASIVIEEMGLGKAKVRFTGGVDGGRGWIGDVKNMLLETSKLKSRGWKPRYNSEQAVRMTVREILSKKALSTGRSPKQSEKALVGTRYTR